MPIARFDRDRSALPGDAFDRRLEAEVDAALRAACREMFEERRVAADRAGTRGIGARSQLVCNRARARERGIGGLEAFDERARAPRLGPCGGVTFERLQEPVYTLVLRKRARALEEPEFGEVVVIRPKQTARIARPRRVARFDFL